MSAEIQLTKGKVALVDDIDFERVNQYKWCATLNNTVWYAMRKNRFGRTVYLHRFIMDAPRGSLVDHRDGDGLNCRRGNMRQSTKSQNAANARMQSSNTSGFRGVHWDSSRKKWVSEITFNGSHIIIGNFNDAELAARSYDQKARELFRDFAKTNF